MAVTALTADAKWKRATVLIDTVEETFTTEMDWEYTLDGVQYPYHTGPTAPMDIDNFLSGNEDVVNAHVEDINAYYAAL